MGCVPRLDLAIFLALATERLSQARIVFVMMVVVVGGDGGVGGGIQRGRRSLSTEDLCSHA